MAAGQTFGERIAEALVEDKLMTREKMDELLAIQKKEGTRLLKLISEKALISEADMMVSMGRVLGTPPINLARLNISPDIMALIPKEIAVNHKVLPVSRLENRLFLAMSDPLNVLAVDDVKRATRMEVFPLIATEKAILEKLSNLEGPKGTMEDIIQDAQKQEEAEKEADNLEVSKESVDNVSLDQLAASSEEAPVIKLANLILIQAIKDRASDIHIEPFEKGVSLRYRIDGALSHVTPPSQESLHGPCLPHQDHEQPRHCRAPAASGRAHACQGCRQGHRPPCLIPAHGSRREMRFACSRQIQPVGQHAKTGHGPRHL